MRKYYLDNIRWVTVVLVVIYHVLYMYNGEGILGGVGKITDVNVQYYDISNLSYASKNSFAIIHVKHMVNDHQNYSYPSDMV